MHACVCGSSLPADHIHTFFSSPYKNAITKHDGAVGATRASSLVRILSPIAHVCPIIRNMKTPQGARFPS